jgi:hypothetical protein
MVSSCTRGVPLAPLTLEVALNYATRSPILQIDLAPAACHNNKLPGELHESS